MRRWELLQGGCHAGDLIGELFMPDSCFGLNSARDTFLFTFFFCKSGLLQADWPGEMAGGGIPGGAYAYNQSTAAHSPWSMLD